VRFRRCWGGQVGPRVTVRQAMLRPECAERYPTLPAAMWTSAARLADLVGSYPASAGAVGQNPGKGRTLPEIEFEFRGGSRRGWGGVLEHTRSGEPA
jgi:hypothetical protein